MTRATAILFAGMMIGTSILVAFDKAEPVWFPVLVILAVAGWVIS